MGTKQKASSLAYRKTSLLAGLLYLLTFVSIPTLGLYKSVKESGYIIGNGPDTAAITGGMLEMIVALAGIGTAVVLYPILKKQNQTMALGLVAIRILEASAIFVGVAFILAIVSLRKSGLGPDPIMISTALVALYNKLFLISQSFLPAINDLLLGVLLYQSRLIPRAISSIGIIGAVPLLIGFVAMMFGVIEQGSSMAGLAALLVALFELLVGIWLVAKGFNEKAVAKLVEQK
jgi:hypothetical protein